MPGILDPILGPILGGGGGGGGSTSVNSTLKVGGDGSTISVDADLDNIRVKELAPIEIKPVTVNSNITSKSDSTASLNLKVEPLNVKLEPVKADVDTNSVIELKPIEANVDTNSVIDLKPVAVDSCQTIKLAPLPPIHIDQPYSQHFGFTFMGMELWGFTISGKSETILRSPSKPQHHSFSEPGHHASNKESPEEQSSVRPRSGLRVRLSE